MKLFWISTLQMVWQMDRSCTVICVQVPVDKKARGVVWVQFEDDDIGRKTRALSRNRYKPGINPSWTPVVPEMRKFTVGRNSEVARTQFPLRAASANTVHRSQRDTVSELVVDFTGRTQTGIHYVAMRRVREFEKLLLNYDPRKVKASASANTVHRSQRDTVSELVVDFTGRTQTGIHYVAMRRVREFEKLLLNYDPRKVKASEESNLKWVVYGNNHAHQHWEIYMMWMRHWK